MIDHLRELLAVQLISWAMRVFPKKSWLGVNFIQMTTLLYQTYNKVAEQEKMRRDLQAEWKQKIAEGK